MSLPVSVIILTHNEEGNIRACLESLSEFDDVHVLDSGSTDATARIATELGISVHVNAPFLGFGEQRNWAIDNIPVKYDWQFHLDADERMTPALTAELRSVVASSPSHGGYQVPSRLLLYGQWLKRAGQYPGYQVRFFHRKRLRFFNYGHGQREVTQHTTGTLQQPLDHHGFSKGIDHWFAKHIVYARREAEGAMAGKGETGPATSGSGAVSRRRALKRLTSRLPGRYFLRLAYMLIWKRAILDGWAGITYAHMLATYDSMIDVYLQLLRHGALLDLHLQSQPRSIHHES